MAVPAGWMPDPHVAGQLRYFDGRGWTTHTAPAPQVVPTEAASTVPPPAAPAMAPPAAPPPVLPPSTGANEPTTVPAPPAPSAPTPVPQVAPTEAAPTVIAPPPAAPTAAPAMAPPAVPRPSAAPTIAASGMAVPDGPTAASRLASGSWRWGNSLWLVLPLVSFGFLTWAGFLYIGIRTSNKLWLGFAGLYFVLIGIAGTAIMITTPAPAPTWAVLLYLAVWIGGFIHSAIVNKQFLLSLVSKAPWYIESAPSLSGPSHRGS